MLPSTASGLYLGDGGDNSSSGIQITFALRIDQSKLTLTCQPDVNVTAGIHWDSGGFVVNISPGARQVAFMGNVGGLTIGLKHGFLSEDCVRLDARDLTFSVTFSKKIRGSGKTLSSISMVLDTELSGGVRFSRLQDILCFKAVWLDRMPVLNGQNMMSASQSTQTGTNVLPGTVVTEQDLSSALLVRVRRIALNADLGQSISSIALDMRDVFLRSRLEVSSEVSFFITDLQISASGNISGNAHIPNFSFRTVRRKDFKAETDTSSGRRMLDLIMTSGPLQVALESDYQRILQFW